MWLQLELFTFQQVVLLLGLLVVPLFLARNMLRKTLTSLKPIVSLNCSHGSSRGLQQRSTKSRSALLNCQHLCFLIRLVPNAGTMTQIATRPTVPLAYVCCPSGSMQRSRNRNSNVENLTAICSCYIQAFSLCKKPTANQRATLL